MSESSEWTDCPVCATFVAAWTVLHAAYPFAWAHGAHSPVAVLVLVLAITLDVVGFVAVLPAVMAGGPFREDFFRAEAEPPED